MPFSNLKKIFRKLFCFLDPPKYTPYVGGSKERHNPQKWLLSLQNLILKYENISFVFFEENQWKSKCQYPGHEINFLSKMCLLTLITMILRKTKNIPHQIEIGFSCILLVASNPCKLSNLTELYVAADRPSNLRGPMAGGGGRIKKKCIQTKLHVSWATGGGRGSLSLDEQ